MISYRMPFSPLPTTRADRLATRRRFVLLLLGAFIALSPFCGRDAWARQGGQKWALVIGVDQYEDANHINALGGAAADARALNKVLLEAAGFSSDHVTLLASDGPTKPTRSNILAALGRLIKNAQPGDLVFVSYSGHGIEVDGKPYLLPYDTSAFDDNTITDTALETAKFHERLRQVKARFVLCAFDMCRSDPRKLGKDVAAPDNRLSPTLARGMSFNSVASGTSSAGPQLAAILYSCSEGERSYEWRDRGRGYFSYFLEEGLRGKAADVSGRITVEGLAQYVQARVGETVSRNERAATKQTPYPELRGPGAGAFVLASVAPGGGLIPTNANPTNVSVRAGLEVKSNVPGASLMVNGTLAPNRAFETDLVTEASRTVEAAVIADGYTPVVQQVTLVRGRTIELSVVLKPVRTAVLKPLRLPATKPLNRADFAQMLYENIYDLDEKGAAVAKSKFPDLDVSSPAYEAANYLTRIYAMIGEPDGSFGTSVKMKRNAAAVVLARIADMFAVRGSEGTSSMTFSDVPVDHWAWHSINAGFKAGYIESAPDDRFRGEDVLTAAELYRWLGTFRAKAFAAIPTVRARNLISKAQDTAKNGDLEGALKLAREARESDPNDTYTAYILGTFLYQKKEYAEAVPHLRASTSNTPPQASFHNLLGTTLYALKDYTGAEQSYRNAIGIKDNDANLHANLACALFAQGRKDDATVSAKRAMELGMKEHWIYKSLGLTP